MIGEEKDQINIEDEKINVVDIRRKSLDLLARREHSRLELSRKLHKKFSKSKAQYLCLFPLP